MILRKEKKGKERRGKERLRIFMFEGMDGWMDGCKDGWRDRFVCEEWTVRCGGQEGGGG